MTPRVALIGTGHWGSNLLRNFDALDAAAAFHDENPATRAAVAAAYPRAHAAERLGDLLADATIDAVAIATPAASHGLLARQALEAGKHVFVEKPLCLSTTEAAALGRLADRGGRVLMVGHLLLYHPAFVALRRFIAAGGLGTLRYVYSNRASLGRIRRESSALWEFAPHDLSMILALAGALPSRIACLGGAWVQPGAADLTLTHLAFEHGIQAHVFVSWLHPYKEHRMVAVGSTGMAAFDDVAGGAAKLLHYPHAVDLVDGLPSVTRAEAVPIPYEPEEPLARECRHFLHCVATGATPLSDWREGARVLAVLEACQRALASGQPVGLEPAL